MLLFSMFSTFPVFFIFCNSAHLTWRQRMGDRHAAGHRSTHPRYECNGQLTVKQYGLVLWLVTGLVFGGYESACKTWVVVTVMLLIFASDGVNSIAMQRMQISVAIATLDTAHSRHRQSTRSGRHRLKPSLNY